MVDGAPAENIYGTDVESEFMDLGYELFRDRDTLESFFFFFFFFSAKKLLVLTAGWEKFNTKMDMIFISSFLRRFD